METNLIQTVPLTQSGFAWERKLSEWLPKSVWHAGMSIRYCCDCVKVRRPTLWGWIQTDMLSRLVAVDMASCPQFLPRLPLDNRLQPGTVSQAFFPALLFPQLFYHSSRNEFSTVVIPKKHSWKHSTVSSTHIAMNIGIAIKTESTKKITKTTRAFWETSRWAIYQGSGHIPVRVIQVVISSGLQTQA